MDDAGLIRTELERAFPRLANTEYELTSPATTRYNCVAWAMGDVTRWWDPRQTPLGGYYWPPEHPRSFTVQALSAIFQAEGYAVCSHDDAEPGYERIAVYGDMTGQALHVARQRASGTWTSKLGEGVDIEHAHLADLEGDEYGQVTLVLRRPASR